MKNLYKDPQGENIFQGLSGDTVSKTSRSTKEVAQVLNESETEGLRKRIMRLEREVKEKDVSN